MAEVGRAELGTAEVGRAEVGRAEVGRAEVGFFAARLAPTPFAMLIQNIFQFLL
jgi:hypothetical protein